MEHIGKKVSRLTVLSSYRGKYVMYVCLCECGKTTEVIRTNLVAAIKGGKGISCGCLRAEQARARSHPDSTIRRGIWNYYRRNAAQRHIGWGLEFEQFQSLIAAPCHYCGVIGGTETASQTIPGASIKNNGVDRVDNTLGYTVTNSVPCCKTCNRAKGELTVADFSRWIVAVYNKSGGVCVP